MTGQGTEIGPRSTSGTPFLIPATNFTPALIAKSPALASPSEAVKFTPA